MADHGRAALLLYGVALVDMAASSLTFALTPGRVTELGGDAKTIGLLSGFVGALQLVAGPLVGRYSDRLADRRWVLILGLLASALGSVAAGAAGAAPLRSFILRSLSQLNAQEMVRGRVGRWNLGLRRVGTSLIPRVCCASSSAASAFVDAASGGAAVAPCSPSHEQRSPDRTERTESRSLAPSPSSGSGACSCTAPPRLPPPRVK